MSKLVKDLNLGYWEMLNSELVLDASPWLRVSKETIRLPNGYIVNDFYTIKKSDYVVMYTVNEKNEVLMLWRYRHGNRKIDLGLPSGAIEKGETPLEAAKRELMEETGFRAKKWEKLGEYTVDGNQGIGKAHLWYGGVLEKVKEADSGDLEEMKIDFMGNNLIKNHMDSGHISTMCSAFAIVLGLNKQAAIVS